MKYAISTDFRVLCLRNIIFDGPFLRAEENRVTSWEPIVLGASTKLYDSIVEAYDRAIDDCDYCLRHLEQQRTTEIENIQDLANCPL
jgi:hypothetical protein